MSRIVCLLLAGLLVALPLYAADDTADLLAAEIAKFQVNGTFEKAVADLSAAGKVKILPDWPVLTAAGAVPDTRVALRARGETLQDLLDTLVLRAAAKDSPLAWYVDGQAIRITTQDNVVHHIAPSPDAPRAATPETAAPAPAAPEVAAPPAAAPKPRDVIRTNTDGAVSFKEMPLKDVIKYFEDHTGLNIVVNWSSLEAVGIAKDTPVTLECRKLSAGRVLDLVLDNISGNRDKFERVYYVIDNGVVTIATGNTLNSKTKSIVIDVTDMLMVVPDFKGPRLDLSMNTINGNVTGTTNTTGTDNNTDSTTANEPTMSEQRAKVQENLINAIKNSIGPEMWQPDGKGSITVFQGKLVITQTQLGFKLMEASVK